MVSIIIPIYNCQKYILRCLESVSRQSYNKIQIIVVDDGSTDGSNEIVENYTKNRPDFIVLYKDNGGVSSARNLALEHVTGEFVYFLDADDCLEDNAIELLVAAMKNDESDWVSCQYSRWGANGYRLEDYHFITGDYLFCSTEDRIVFATEKLLRYYVGYEVWNKLYRADIILNNNIIFSEKCSIGEDLAFNLKYLIHSCRLSCIEDRCVRYTVREDSAMGKLSSLSRKLRENMLLLKDVYDYATLLNEEYFLKGFPLLCYLLLDNSYIGYTPYEICEGYNNAEDISFIKDRYKEIESAKADVIALYPEDIAKIKFRYHMFVYHTMTGFNLADRLNLLVYDLYRIMRKRQTLAEWKMPY